MWLPTGRTLATDKKIHGRRSEHIISFIFSKLVRLMRWYLSQFWHCSTRPGSGPTQRAPPAPLHYPSSAQSEPATWLGTRITAFQRGSTFSSRQWSLGSLSWECSPESLLETRRGLQTRVEIAVFYSAWNCYMDRLQIKDTYNYK